MQTKYYVHSWPSMAGGLVAAASSVALLTRDAFASGFTLDHALMPVLVGLTVLVSHEAWRAMKECKPVSTAGLLLLAVMGSGLIVTETMGRRAEIRDSKTIVAQDAADRRTEAIAALAGARADLAKVEPERRTECHGAPDPLPPRGWPKCRRLTGEAEALQSRIAGLETTVAAMKPAPVDPKAERVAAAAVLFGIAPDHATARAAYQQLDPYLLSLFLELGSLILLGFGIRHREVSEAATVSAEVSGGRLVEERKALTFERPLTDREIEDLRSLLIGCDRPMTQRELAALASVSPGEMSKRVAKAETAGVIRRWKDGRHDQVVLVH